MNITASTLYLIAAPSTPKEGRVEVLQRTSNGENIGYTKAKAIVSQHRKTKKGTVEPKIAPLKPNEPVNVIEPRSYETMSAISAQENLTEKDALAETRPLLTLQYNYSKIGFSCRAKSFVICTNSRIFLSYVNFTDLSI